jgi:hypothetical protein
LYRRLSTRVFGLPEQVWQKMSALPLGTVDGCRVKCRLRRHAEVKRLARALLDDDAYRVGSFLLIGRDVLLYPGIRLFDGRQGL